MSLEKCFLPEVQIANRSEMSSSLTSTRSPSSTRVPNMSLRSASRHYKVVRFLGEGSFGRVYQATEESTNRTVAIKRLPKYGTSLGREIEILQYVDHPNCIKLLDYFFSSDGEITWQNMVFPFYPKSLKDLIHEKNKLRMDVIKRMFFQICQGLEYLHSNGIVHRDLTPSNILMDTDGDQRFWEVLEDDEANTTYVTSRFYRAPELFIGSTQYTSQVDVWSLGTVLYELVFGTPLFKGKDDTSHFVQIVMFVGTPSQTDCLGVPPENANLLKVEGIKFRNILPANLHDLADLLGNIFNFNPRKRPTVKDILSHRFVIR